MADIITNIIIPETWVKCELKEVLSLKNGFAFKSSNYISEGIPVIRISDINEGYVLTGKSVKVKEKEEYEDYKVEKGDILIAMSGATTGKFGIYNSVEKAYQNQRVGNFKPHIVGLLNKHYVYYLLFALKDNILNSAYGGAQPNISNGKIEEFKIPLAPLNEQNRIVDKLDELLSELEKGKEQLQTSLEQLKVYRQSILKHAFEGKLSEEWRKKQRKLKTPDELLSEIKAYRKQQYEKQLKEYKAGKIKIKPKEPKDISLPTKSELADKPKLPEGWTYVALNEIVENDSTKISPSKESKLKFVGMDCIEPHSLYPFKYHEFSDFKSAGNYFEKDRVLYGRMRPYLNKVWRTEFAGACSGEFLVLHPTPVLNPDFLKYKLHSSEYVSFAMSKISGDRPRIAYDEVLSYIFPICSIEEQQEAVQKIESLFSTNNEMEKSIEENLMKSDVLKQGLLQKAFEGKLVEQDPSDEPASVLLERIKKEREEYLKAEKENRKNKIKSKIINMEENLLSIIENNFKSKEFTYDDLKKVNSLTYTQLKKELFDLIESKIINSRFDKKTETILYSFSK